MTNITNRGRIRRLLDAKGALIQIADYYNTYEPHSCYGGKPWYHKKHIENFRWTYEFATHLVNNCGLTWQEYVESGSGSSHTMRVAIAYVQANPDDPVYAEMRRLSGFVSK